MKKVERGCNRTGGGVSIRKDPSYFKLRRNVGRRTTMHM